MEEARKALVAFWRKLGKLIDSGIPLLDSLSAGAKETADAAVRQALQDVEARVTSGKNMSEALAAHPEYFPPSVREMTKAGEVTGTLDTYASKIADALEQGTFDVGQPGVTAPMPEPDVDDLPEVQLAAVLLKDAFERGVSDIHIERLSEGMRTRYRIDGVLHEAGEQPPEDLREALVSRIKIMAGMDAAEKRLPQDGRIKMSFEGKLVDYRVSTVPNIAGESVTIRVLTQESVLVPLEKQGFSEDNLKQVRRWVASPNGIVIVTGPAGCGKTTTLYGLIQELNSDRVKITTAEDPPEIQMDGVNQVQVRPHLGLTYPRIIRSQLRQDPDIMMLGEIRDPETLQLAIQAALTGHLVLTTLHAGDGAESVRRLLDMGIEPFLVNASLVGVLSQRLVRTLCQDCKEEYEPEGWVKELAGDSPNALLQRGRGCAKCHNYGYRGRTVIHELLEMDDVMRSLVLEGPDSGEIRERAVERGVITLRGDGIAKAKEGITTIEEVVRVTT